MGKPRKLVNSPYYTITQIEKMLQKIDVQNGGCWQWVGAITLNGYGTAKINYFKNICSQTFISGYLWIIVPRQQLDHLCRNRRCVNPKHLEAVTPRQNILRGEGLAAQNINKTHCKNGHKFTITNTYFRQRSGRKPERDCISCRRESSKKWRLSSVA